MATPNGVRATLRFGAYELDAAGGVLRKDGIRVHCQEQPLQVLAALVERPGELVTREELRRRVWAQDTFVDFDHALNTAVKKIRATLNDDADAPRYIETVPRRGYRFVGQVDGGNSSSLAQRLFAQRSSFQSGYRRSLALGAAAIALLVILEVAWKIGPWRGMAASAAPEFQRLTFDLPELGDARFTPDAASVVYTAGRSRIADIYAQRLSAVAAQSLGTPDSVLLAVSRQGELAILDEAATPHFDIAYWNNVGTLASLPLGGGAPRKLLPKIEAADWSPDGQLAVVRQVGHSSRLEFPVGKVLYQTAGWIASPRFSPSGDAIAFLDHPAVPDDRGSVVIVDIKGTRKAFSGFWESERGLAWAPRGDEVWFAATHSGVSRALYALSLNGHERSVLSIAGGLTLKDISRDGRVLLARDNERLGILFMGAGETHPRELSWKDWSMATDISVDGKQILFGEEGENSGFSYQVGLRPTDGSQPVILGSGAAQSLSPDGKWALSRMPSPNDQMVLLPTGAGTPRPLERGPVERYQFGPAKWFPDSRKIVFAGFEPGHGPRCYSQSIDGGKPRPFTVDGVAFCTVSPSGSILALTEDSHALLYASDASDKPDRDFNLEPEEMPSGWTSDGKFLYLAQTKREPFTIVRFEIATGRRQPWKQFPMPADNMESKCLGVVITPDGQSFAYTYMHHISDLYVVHGVK